MKIKLRVKWDRHIKAAEQIQPKLRAYYRNNDMTGFYYWQSVCHAHLDKAKEIIPKMVWREMLLNYIFGRFHHAKKA